MAERIKAKDIVITVAVIIVFAVALMLVLNIYKSEGEKRSASISDIGEKDPNHIEVDVKLVSIDPNKGDVVARMEFLPKGHFTTDEGSTLARDLKLFVNSATGKQELEFPKGKRMNPMEVVVNMYDGLVTDYPFDKHSAYLEFYFVPGKESAKDEKKSETPKPAEATATPAPSAVGEEQKKEEGEKKAEPAEKSDDIIPIGVDFAGSIPGFKIDATKAKDSDEDLVGIDMIRHGHDVGIDDLRVAFDAQLCVARAEGRARNVFIYRRIAFRFCRSSQCAAGHAADRNLQ